MYNVVKWLEHTLIIDHLEISGKNLYTNLKKKLAGMFWKLGLNIR